VLAFFTFGLRSSNLGEDGLIPPEGGWREEENDEPGGEIMYIMAQKYLMYLTYALTLLILCFNGVVLLFSAFKGVTDLHVWQSNDDDDGFSGWFLGPLLHLRSRIDRTSEYWLNILCLSIPDEEARASPLYSFAIVLFCAFCFLANFAGMVLYHIDGPGVRVGSVILLTFMLAWIPQMMLAISFFMLDLRKKQDERFTKFGKIICSFSVVGTFACKSITYLSAGDYFNGLPCVASGTIAAFYFKHVNEMTRVAARQFSVAEKRAHILSVSRVIMSNVPTQFYFTAEMFACVIRQSNGSVDYPGLTFTLTDNGCNVLGYGLTPIAYFNFVSVVQYLVHGLWSEYLNTALNLSLMQGSKFQLYR